MLNFFWSNLSFGVLGAEWTLSTEIVKGSVVWKTILSSVASTLHLFRKRRDSSFFFIFNVSLTAINTHIGLWTTRYSTCKSKENFLDGKTKRQEWVNCITVCPFVSRKVWVDETRAFWHLTERHELKAFDTWCETVKQRWTD